MRPITLTLDAVPIHGELVGGFVQRAAALTVDARGAAALARAGEETFQYVSEQAGGSPVTLVFSAKPYAASLEIAFDAARFAPAMFNLTRTLDLDDDDLADLPLLIAARSVDRFDITMRSGEPIRLRLEKDRTYPPIVTAPQTPPGGDGPISVRPGDVDLLRHFGTLLAGQIDIALVPPFARHADRLADFVLAGEVAGALAVNGEGQTVGGILWRAKDRRLASFYGPYVLAQSGRAGIAAALVEACIGALSRSHVTALFGRYGGPDLPAEYFETLGTLLPPDQAAAPIPALFRHLDEDSGTAVWADPAVKDFLEATYDQLALVREIRMARAPAEGVSVLAVGFDRANGMATIRPILPGSDAPANVAAHLDLLRTDTATILAELDLGRAGDASFIPAFLASGFVPRFVVPGGGREDLLVLQHPGTNG